MFEVNLDVLGNTLYRSKYQDIDSSCTNCIGMQLESIKHVVLKCKALNLAPLEGESDLVAALEFTDEDGLIDLTRVT